MQPDPEIVKDLLEMFSENVSYYCTMRCGRGSLCQLFLRCLRRFVFHQPSYKHATTVVPGCPNQLPSPPQLPQNHHALANIMVPSYVPGCPARGPQDEQQGVRGGSGVGLAAQRGQGLRRPSPRLRRRRRRQGRVRTDTRQTRFRFPGDTFAYIRPLPVVDTPVVISTWVRRTQDTRGGGEGQRREGEARHPLAEQERFERCTSEQ